MSAVTSPAASPVAPPTKGAAPPSQTKGVQSLAAFIDVMANKAQEQAKDDTPAEHKGQQDAASGKPLPVKDDKADPALAWLLASASIVLPKPVALAIPVIPATAVATAPVPLDATLVAQAAIGAASAPPTLPQAPTPIPVPIPVADGAVADDVKAATQNIQPVPPSEALTTPLTKITLEPVAAPTPALAPTAPSPALFALALAAQSDTKRDATSAAPSGAPSTATLLQPADATAMIAKPGGAQGQALDMGRQDWPQKMIDHIEALRDGANANDTSIRLKPEALGRIDIALRTHADGAISVRFTAEQSATRSLIADATPQLSAAAESRGIRLSGTSVDLAGSGMGGERPRPTVELSQKINNHLTASGEDIPAVADGRIA